MKKSSIKTSRVPIIVITGISCFILGLALSLIIFKLSKSNLYLASTEEKAKATAEITDKYLRTSSVDCSDPTDPIKPQDRVQVFKDYLKVNSYANRAVIRGCNNVDTLLYKNKKGEWARSTVNISLDRRANPKWQKECLIQDITKADTVVRPENASIDASNYELCAQLPK